MNQADCELDFEQKQRQNARIVELAQSVQAMTLAYQDVSTALEEAKREIAELRNRLEADEQFAAWYQKERA